MCIGIFEGICKEIHGTIDSTQMEARRRVSCGNIKFPTVILADIQTNGIGRRSNVWESASGNFFGTFVLKFQSEEKRVSDLSFVIACSVWDSLRCFLNDADGLFCKWPNDILLYGKKICGIILERQFDALMIGIGVNLLYAPKGFSVSIADYTGNPPSRDQFLDVLLEKMNFWWNEWEVNGFSFVRSMWLERAKNLLGREIFIKELNISGMFESVDEQGYLVLRLPSGECHLISSGDIFFLDKENRTTNEIDTT